MRFDAAFEARLAALDLALRRALPASRRGDRRSPRRKGSSLEFADHRAYAPGDDVRHLDWSALARLDQLLVRVYHDEEELELNLVLDESASMSVGEPPKCELARGVVMALAYIAAGRGHRITLSLLTDECTPGLPRSGRAAYESVREALAGAEAKGRRSLGDRTRELVGRRVPRGMTVLVSDFLDPEGPAAVLRCLQRPSLELNLIQVLAPEELDPQLDGDLVLEDLETSTRVEVSTSLELLTAYRRRARAFVALWADDARRRGAAFASFRSDEALETVCLSGLLREGILR